MLFCDRGRERERHGSVIRCIWKPARGREGEKHGICRLIFDQTVETLKTQVREKMLAAR